MNSRPLAIIVAEKAMHEFCQQWLSGLQPSLSLETAPDGEIRVCCKVIAGDASHSAHHSAQHPDAEKARKRHHRGPSYRRRLARRAAARKAAVDKAVQVSPALPDQLPNVPLDAVHAPDHHVLLRDELCPDKDYVLPCAAVPSDQHRDHVALDQVPQVDGHADADDQEEEIDEEWINPCPTTGSWLCRCCYYAHWFTSEEELKKHHDKLTIEYDECNICYPWHVWT